MLVPRQTIAPARPRLRDNLLPNAAPMPPMPSAPVSLQGTFSHRETVLILSGVMLALFLAALDQTIVATALPKISGDLNGAGALAWVISAYLLTSTASTPIYGKLSDLYGRRVMLQAAVVIFLATSVLCALATSMGQLIAFRALQGLGGGGLQAMAHATIADVIAPRERGRYQGYLAGNWAAASICGPILGGVFADHLTWRWVFWINVPFGIIALVIAKIALTRLGAKRIRHRIDYPGAVLLVLAITALLLVTTLGGQDYAWGSPTILGLIAASLVLFGLYAWQETHAKEPITPPRLFANPTFLLSSIITLINAIGLLGGIVFLPLLMQLVFGLDAGQSGLMLIPLSVAAVSAALFAGRMVAATGRYKIYPVVGMILSVLGAAMLAFMDTSNSLWMVGVSLFVMGFGAGMVNPVMLVVVQNAVELRDLGTATSSVSFFRSMGGAFGIALFSAVLIGRLGTLLTAVPGAEVLGSAPALDFIHAGPQALANVPTLLRQPVMHAAAGAFRAVFLLSAGISFLGLLCAFRLHEVPLRSSTSAAASAKGEPPTEGAELAGLLD